MLQQSRAIEPLGLQPTADQPGPLVAADVSEGGRLHAQAGHGHARVAHDPAGDHLEWLGGQQPPAADGHSRRTGRQRMSATHEPQRMQSMSFRIVGQFNPNWDRTGQVFVAFRSNASADATPSFQIAGRAGYDFGLYCIRRIGVEFSGIRSSRYATGQWMGAERSGWDGFWLAWDRFFRQSGRFGRRRHVALQQSAHENPQGKIRLRARSGLVRALAAIERAFQLRRLRVVRVVQRAGADQSPRRRRRLAKAQQQGQELSGRGLLRQDAGPGSEVRRPGIERADEHRGRHRAGQRGRSQAVARWPRRKRPAARS